MGAMYWDCNSYTITVVIMACCVCVCLSLSPFPSLLLCSRHKDKVARREGQIICVHTVGSSFSVHSSISTCDAEILSHSAAVTRQSRQARGTVGVNTGVRIPYLLIASLAATVPCTHSTRLTVLHSIFGGGGILSPTAATG